MNALRLSPHATCPYCQGGHHPCQVKPKTLSNYGASLLSVCMGGVCAWWAGCMSGQWEGTFLPPMHIPHPPCMHALMHVWWAACMDAFMGGMWVGGWACGNKKK